MRANPRHLSLTGLFVFLFLLLFFQTVRADDSGTFGTCSWKISNGTLSVFPPVSGGTCKLDPFSTCVAVPTPSDDDLSLIYPDMVSDSTGTAISSNRDTVSTWPHYNTEITSISIAKGVQADTSLATLCYGMSGLTNISGLANLDVSNVTNMSSMFYGCSKLEDPSPLKNWKVSNVTDMSSMFEGCSSLSFLAGPFSNWNVSNVTNMNSMFKDCTSLFELVMPGYWNVSNVTDMDSIFANTNFDCYDEECRNGGKAESLSTSNIKKYCFGLYVRGVSANSDGNAVKLTWQALSDAKSYEVAQCTSSEESSCTVIKTGLTGTSYDVTGLDYGTDYGFMLRAVMSNGGYSEYSDKVKVTTGYGIVSGLKATPSGNTVTLEWDALPGAKSYRVCKGTSAAVSCGSTLTTTDTTYTVTGLNCGTTYYFAICAGFSGGYYHYMSNVVSATTGKISGLKATPSGNTVKLEWDALAGAKSYQVCTDTSAAVSCSSASTTTDTAYTVTGLNCGTTYYFAIRVRLGGSLNTKYSDLSNVVSATTGKISGLKATPSGNTVKLEWDALAGAEFYQVCMGTSAAVSCGSASTTTDTAYTVTRLNYGTTYYFAIRVRLGGSLFNTQYSDLSNVVSVSTGNGQVSGLRVDEYGENTVSLRWESLDGAKSYEVYQCASENDSSCTVRKDCQVSISSVEEYIYETTVKELNYGTTYYFKVRALMANKEYSEYSTAVSASTGNGKVSGLTITPVGNTMKLTWTALAGAQSYEVCQYTPARGGSCTVEKKGLTGAACDVTKLNYGTTYYFKVRALMANKEYSEYSTVVSASTGSGQVSGLKATPGGNTMKLTWTALAGAKSYEVYQCTSSTGSDCTAKKDGLTDAAYDVTNLNYGTMYYFKVRARMSNSKYSSYSAVVSASTSNGKIGSLKAVTEKNTNTVTLTWTALPGAVSYEVHQSTAKNFASVNRAKASKNTYKAENLNYGAVYYFKVRALMANKGYSEYSTVVSASTSNGQISGLKVSLSGTTVKLSWNALRGVTSYEIWRSKAKTSGYAQTGTATGTSYKPVSLSCGNTYYFKVRGKLANGQYSGWSSIVSAVMPKLSVSGLKAVLSGTTAKLSWSKVPGAAKYSVYRSTSKDSGFKEIGTADNAAYKDSGLSCGKTYYYKVRTLLTSKQYSSTSTVVSVKPVQVSGLKAALDDTTAKLSWSKLSGAKSYMIYRSSTSAKSGYEKIGTIKTASFDAGGMKYGTTYYYKVAAVLSNGTSSYSAVVSVKPVRVTGLNADFSGTTAKLSWSKLADAEKYYVYRSTSGNSGFKKIGTASDASYSVKNLKDGKMYYFKVRARMSSGEYSAYSSVIAVGRPAGLKAEISLTTAKLSWSKLSGAKTYYVYQSTSEDSGFTKIGSVSSTAYSVKSLKEGETYYFKVRAKLSTGETSEYSFAVKVFIPPQVKGLKAELKGTSVKLSWDKLTGAKSYEFYVTNTATGNSAHDSCTANYAKITVGYGKSYSFKVRAKLHSGYSAFSDTVTVKVPKKAAAAATASRAAVPVENLSASVSGQSVKLSWEKLGSAKSYEIYRSVSKNSGYEKIGTVSKASYEAAKQGYGQTRYYKVRALLKDGSYSEFSSAVKAMIPAAPTAVPTVVPTQTAVPTAAPVQTEDHAANITEECSADGSSCTIVEKVCTETECTITSKVCVVVGDQRACADPVVTVVPVLTETPVVTETAASEVTPTVEATATEMPAVAEVTEECSEDGSSCTVYEKVCTETECTVTSRICVVVGDQKACSDPVVTVVPVLTETPVQTEEVAAEPTATEEVPAEPTATEEAPAEPTATEEIPEEPAMTEEVPAEPTVTEDVPAEPTATEEVAAEPAVTEEVATEPAVTEEVTEEPAATEEATEEPAATEEVPEEPAMTEEVPAEPTATEEVATEPAVTEEVATEPAVTEEAPAEPAVTEEMPAEPAATEEAPAEPTATEESLAESVGMDEVSAEEVPTEDLTIREINIADLTEDTISFNAQESYTIAPERLKIVPEAADWAELKLKLEDESVATFRSRDIEVIRAEGLTIQGLQPGSTTLRIQAGEVEKSVTLVISLSEADIQAALEAETAVQAAE